MGGVFRLDRLLAIALGGGLCAWIAAQAIDNADHIARANSGELYLGYAAPRWTESETLRYLRDNLSGATIYINQRVPAHFHSGGNAGYHHGMFGRPIRDTASPWRLINWATRNHGAYLAWLDDGNPPRRVSVVTMRAREGLEPVAEFADGAVFRVNGEYKPTSESSPHFAAYSAIARGEAARLSSGADFDVYIHQDTLIYFKRPCDIADIQARFFLHVFPENAAYLPDDRRGYRFENLDFEFKWRGALFEDNCVAMMPLPSYESDRIRTGQYAIDGSGSALWEAEVAVSARRRYRQAHRAANAGDYGGAAAESNFAVYLDDDSESKALVYVKERCAADDTQARFFLHIIPYDAADLPDERKGQGFDNLDFRFAEYGADLGGACVAVRELPEYGVERVRTGQYVSGEGALWRAEFGADGGE